MSTDPKFNTLHTDLFDLGIQNRRAVVGDAYVDAALRNGSSEFAWPGQQLVTE
jgi:4-carboxymuconolactone decarboxylase